MAQPLPEYEILLSIPGRAETTATSIIGELGDIRRFHSANQINAFIGIDLRHYESGEFLAKEHITKRGNPYARKILFKCIHNIASPSHTNPCYITDFYENRQNCLCYIIVTPYKKSLDKVLVLCTLFTLKKDNFFSWTMKLKLFFIECLDMLDKW